MHYTYYLLHNSAFNSCVGMHWHWLAVVPDDDPLPLEDPAGVRTPPTPPVVPTHSQSPAPLRQRAMAHLRPVSIPDLVSNMAGKDPTRKIADFDRHYMPDGQPSPDVSARGDADDHRSELKRKADGISRSLSEDLAYLTHGTASLEEAKKLLTIITNVNYILDLAVKVALYNIYITLVFISSSTLSRRTSRILNC
jgi:hypothetical protein